MTSHGSERVRPPRLASWLLRRLLPRDARAASIAGDLIEEFNADRRTRSRPVAAGRYWRNALSIALRYAFTSHDSGRTPRQVPEEGRTAAWRGVIRQDLRYGVRSLLKAPGFTAVAVLTLAIGVGANTAIFSVLHAVVLRDLPYREPDRLVLLWTVNLRQNIRDGSSYANYRDWKERSRTIEATAIYFRPQFTQATITGGRTDRVQQAMVGPGFFDVLGVPPLLGRPLQPGDFEAADASIVISHSLWRQRFAGDPAVLGTSLELDGQACRIVGVMGSEFAFPSDAIQVWRPIALPFSSYERSQQNPAARGGDGLIAIGRLARAATLGEARAELSAIAARLREQYPGTNSGNGVLVEPLTDHVIGPRTARSLWFLFAAVGLVLVIACANVANLAFARGALRRSEFSLRTALGANRGRLVRQLLAENLVLATLSAMVGLLLASLMVAALQTWAATALPRFDTIALNATVFVFALVISAMCGLIAGLLPALRLSTANPVEALREHAARIQGGSATLHVRGGLVIAEVALAVVLLSAAGLLIRSFVRVQNADRGFDSHHVLLLQVALPREYDGQAAKARYFAEAFERIRRLPGVAAAGAIGDLFIERQPDLRVTLERQPVRPADEPAPPLTRDRVIPGYFEAMRIPLLEGRLLEDSDLSEDIDARPPDVIVINESMARRFWPGQSAVGKRLKFGAHPRVEDPWVTVVGVVADMKRQKLDENAIPCIFSPGFGSQMDIVVRTLADPAAMKDAIRAELQAVDSAVPPYGVLAIEQRLGETVAMRTFQTLLLSSLAAAALFLAVVGVYGAVHQSVVVRTREIGVRVALGASRASVLRMVLSSALRLALCGVGLGVLGAFALGRTISVFLYETSPGDPATFGSVAALLLAVTTAACLSPARRAASVEPMAALRAD